MRPVVLASSSPRRLEMMEKNHIECSVIPADVDEDILMPMSLESTVMFLALKKALYVEQLLSEGKAGAEKKITESDASLKGASHCLYPEAVITAADTVVYKDGVMGKPKDRQEARDMLLCLKGCDHIVATGVAMICPETGKKIVFCDKTKVFFRDYSDEELESYISTDEPYDKAGGYAIQGTFSKYTDHIEGDRDNVIGFPFYRFREIMERIMI